MSAKDKANDDAARPLPTVTVPTELWKNEPDDHDYPAALSYLGLCIDPERAKHLVEKLRTAPIVMHPAKDLLRSSGLELLGLDDPSVKRDLVKVVLGDKLSPVLVLRGDLEKGQPSVIADGYHRMCASYHLSENELIPCRITDR
ncbi:MAG: hypothetical protein QG661_265 [Actinomycetota bacterium]|nr:hypothetical protein [Actinomycetota bacterium]